ncbi:MAG: hypothetical protein PHI16_03725 [Methanocellales archaeon]|nr:hypothetical protein [Methanocellales archaeon]
MEGAKKTLKEWNDVLGRELMEKQLDMYKEQNEIKLTPVKTLDEWFANLPLIYKLDLYNNYSDVITKHLK